MTNMKKFAAQQLTKKEMNEAKGGINGRSYCTLLDENGNDVGGGYVMGAPQEARMALLKIYADMGYDAFCNDSLY